MEAVLRRLGPLLDELSSVAFAVSPTQLTLAGSATDPDHPLLRDLAAWLFRRNVGMIRFGRGLTHAEVDSLLSLLNQEGAPSAPPRISHVEVEALNFQGLGLQGGLGPLAPEGGPSRATAVWTELANAVLGELATPRNSGAAELAFAFDSTPSEPVRDEAVLAGLSATAAICRDASPSEASVLRRQLSHLLRGLRPATLERLFSDAGRGHSSRAVLGDLVDLAAAPVALDLLLAAARAEHRALSPALVRLLTKLASHAEAGPPSSRHLADEQFRRRCVS